MKALETVTFLLLASATAVMAVRKAGGPGPVYSGASGIGNGGVQKFGYNNPPYNAGHGGGGDGGRAVAVGGAVPLLHAGSGFSKVFVRPSFMIKTKQGDTYMVKTVHHVQKVYQGEPMLAFTGLGGGHGHAGGYGNHYGPRS